MTTKTWDRRWAVFNHIGEPWMPLTWDSQEEAQHYLDDQRRKFRAWGGLSRYRVLPVIITISQDKG